jgi:hypothetical protein
MPVNLLRNHKKYVKKVIVTTERSSGDARAERLKRLRNLANLSREQMCESGELNINTLKGWEIGGRASSSSIGSLSSPPSPRSEAAGQREDAVRRIQGGGTT